MHCSPARLNTCYRVGHEEQAAAVVFRTWLLLEHRGLREVDERQAGAFSADNCG